MHNKGFTLIELVATLIVLSMVALIVVPNIYNNVKDYRQQLYETQLVSIETATKNWVADHIGDENFPKENNETLFVYLDDLQEGGYIDDDLKNPLTRKRFNNLVFVVIECEVILGDDFNADNYKYNYRVIDTTTKYLAYMAELWFNDNEESLIYDQVNDKNQTLIKLLTKEDLYDYIDENLLVTQKNNSIKNIENSELIENYSAKIYATKKGNNYIYNYEGIIN